MKKRPFLVAFALFGGIFLTGLLLLSFIGLVSGKSASLPLGEKIGVIEVNGIIASSKKTIERITDFRDEGSIKAIVLRVDSPGGGVGPSQEIYREVQKLAAVKPVVVSMGGVAASGGYYIAAPATRVLANPGTITGSIGVIMEFTNVEDLMGKVGLKSLVVKSGTHKDIGSPVRTMTGEDRQILQGLIDDVHQQFVTAVATGRHLEEKEVRLLADGRIFSGRQALDLGLVDQLGNLEDAVDVAAELAGITGKPRTVYPRDERPRILEYIIQETLAQTLDMVREPLSGGLQFAWSGAEEGGM